MNEELTIAQSALDAGQNELALDILVSYTDKNPGDCEALFWCACAHDRLGLERKAIPYYQRAIALGLPSDLEQMAYVGLGSSLRCLGDYGEAKQVLEAGMTKHPDFGAIRVFWAMTLLNIGEADAAVRELLNLLVDSSADISIKKYSKAIIFYADHLREKWE